MKRKTTLFLLTLFATSIFAFTKFVPTDCICDKNKVEQTIKNKNFNAIPNLDTCKLYNLSSADNRILWYRDIESPDSTKFTKQWNDYVPANYHASHSDFLKFYDKKKDIELAFQFGPNDDLWAYHIFVVKKIDCCYLVTRSYFRHARFTYKAYSIINESKLDSLCSTLATQEKMSTDSIEKYGYRGCFMDNRNKQKFYLDLSKATPELSKLFDFVDHKIDWTKTYHL